MKKLFIFTLAVIGFLLPVCVNAQINFNLESWTTKFNIASPDNWFTLNVLASTKDSVSCNQSNDAYEGQYSAKIRSIKYSGLPGLIFSGQLIQSYISNNRPKSFRFAYKFYGPKKDTGSAVISFYKGPIKDPSSIVGSVSLNLDTTSTWTYKMVDIIWTKPDAPDTVAIGFFSGRFSVESWLQIDAVSVSEYSAKSNNDYKKELPLFSIHKKLLFPTLNCTNYNLILFSNTGQELRTVNIKPQETYDFTTLADGIYFYKILDPTRPNEYTSGKLFLVD